MTLVPRRLLLAVSVACLGLPAVAGAAPHLRTGICVGVGFGLESLSWSDADGDREVQGSGSANARVGYALKPDLVLGVEFWGWAKEYELLASGYSVPTDVRITATTACATLFPGSGGLFVRLGAGVAYGRVEFSPPPGLTLDTTTDSTTGLALNLAPGYEFRFTRHFALGAQGDLVYLGLDGPFENVFGYGINAQFNWYW